jgi:glycosyltransferase involved in cell wall biosynthesis
MLEGAALRHHRLRKRAAWQLFDRQALHGAALWHATSPTEATTLRARGEAIDVVEIPNALTRPQPDRGSPSDLVRALTSQPFVLFLGRLHPIKRLDLLAESFARALGTAPDARLVVAGPDELNTRAALEPVFAPIAQRVTWLGAVGDADKRELLTHARMLVMCSDAESFGMSVAEALAAATPVVVTRTCPWALVEADACGLWVDQNADAIAHAIALLWQNPERAAEMGRRGRAAVTRLFAPEAIGTRWRETYQGVLSRAAVGTAT